MINKLMYGRLGNQMFQYATVRAIQKRYYKDEPINLNFGLVYREGKSADGFKNQLIDFRLSPYIQDERIRLSPSQKMMFLRYVLGYKMLKMITRGDYEIKKREYEIKLQDRLQKKGLFIFSYGYWNFKKVGMKDKLFVGFFESDKYFSDIRAQLKEEFTPKYPERKENERLYKIIRDNNSVCVSIRRGDFLADSRKDDYYVCTPEYYEKAITEIAKRVTRPRFVVFSDDIKWVKQNMKFPEGTVFEHGNDPVWEKLRLMYECKHFIMSNSTFCWWAQFLSSNERGKVVIAPKKWRDKGYNEDIYQDNWIRI